VWLDNFFRTNITPLFYIETLADLEKEVAAGRTPEQVVGSLAHKTPDSGSLPNVHHGTLIAGEVGSRREIHMRYVPVIAGGTALAYEGTTGIVFDQAPEAEAFRRWQKRESLDLERSIARAWREALSAADYDEVCEALQRKFFETGRPRSLGEAKSMADDILDHGDQGRLFGSA
jgi:hypothetical protein